MARKLMAICLSAVFIISCIFAVEAYDITETYDAVTVTRNGNVYTVNVNHKAFSNSQLGIIAVANGSDITVDKASDKFAYQGEKTADSQGRAEFVFEPKEGFDSAEGLYVAVSSDRDITFFGSEYGIAKVKYEISYSVTGEGSINAINAQDITDEEGNMICAVAEEGDNVEFKAIPEEGYVIKSAAYNGNTVSFNDDSIFITEPVLSDGTLAVEFAKKVENSVSDVIVYNDKIERYRFINEFGEDFPHEARTAKVATAVFSKLSGEADECGFVYSKTDVSPEAGKAECVITPVNKTGNNGSFGMYYFADEALSGTKINVRAYLKIGNEYIYSPVVEMTLGAAN